MFPPNNNDRETDEDSVTEVDARSTCSGADPGFWQGGWLAGPQNISRRAAPRKIFGAVLGGYGGMLPQKIFKIESARLA